MQLSDVINEYPKCTFCGLGIRWDHAYRPTEESPWYHTEECYQFSRRYPTLLERLRTEQRIRNDRDK